MVAAETQLITRWHPAKPKLEPLQPSSSKTVRGNRIVPQLAIISSLQRRLNLLCDS